MEMNRTSIHYSLRVGVQANNNFRIYQVKVTTGVWIVVSLGVPVARKVAMTKAHDSINDWMYWLNQSPSERLETVTFIISQSLGKS